MFYIKAAFKIFLFFTGKRLRWSLFFEVADLQAYKFMKKRLQHWCFPVNIVKFLRTPILKNICELLLLNFFHKIL